MTGESSTHEVSRRTFIKGSALTGLALAASGGAASLFGCAEGGSTTGAGKNTPREEEVLWTHCSVNCEGRCAIQAHVSDDEVVWVEGDTTGDDVYGNHQIRPCQRGRSIRRWLNHPDRLSYPMKRVGKRGEGKFEQISWDEALDTIAENYQRILDEYGPASIYSHYATGVNAANIPSFLGRFLNINGGHLNRYGSYSSAQISNALPYLYGKRAASSNSDIVNAKLVVMFGENSCETKQGGAGPTYHLMHALEEGGAKLIIIDPRYSDSVASRADQWIPIRPGTDAALVDAIAYTLITEDLVNHEFLDRYCIGYDEEHMPESKKGQNLSYRSYILGEGSDATPKTPAWASAITLIPEETIVQLAREIGTTAPCSIYQGKGPQRRANGEQTARAICMLPILTGNVGVPGTNSGSDIDSYYLGWPEAPAPDNAVEASIATFTWIDAVDHGEKMTRTHDGVRGVEKLEVPIKFIWNYAGNCLTNQHGDINRVHDILADESKCEFIVLWDTFMTDSARYADILLPDLMPAEQPALANNDYAGNMGYFIMSGPVTSAKFERRTLYSVLTDLADRMGVKDEFTEGLDEWDWLEKIWETQREDDTALPSYDEMLAMGVYKREDPDGHQVAFKSFRDDPVKNPLKTPSGLIEIYSEKLEQTVADWEIADGDLISPLPVYCPEVEGYADPLAKKYPLQMFGYHYKARAHSSYGCIDVLQQANPQEMWMNPVDAKARNISDGDSVRVYNDRGALMIPVKVTNRILPGVVAMGQGAWHDADMSGDKLDKGSCVNTLTSSRPSPLAHANPSHTNLVEVAKA